MRSSSAACTVPSSTRRRSASARSIPRTSPAMRTITRTNSTAQAPATATTSISPPRSRWRISRTGATRAAAPMASSRPRPRRAWRRRDGSDSLAIDGCSPAAPSST